MSMIRVELFGLPTDIISLQFSKG